LTTNDLYQLRTCRRVRLHPHGETGAVILSLAVDERRYVTTLHWVTRVGGTFEVTSDAQEGVLDLVWAPAGNRWCAVRRRDGGAVLEVGDWKGTSSIASPDAAFVLPMEPERVGWNRAGDALCVSLRRAADAVGFEREYVYLRDVFPFKHEGRGIEGEGRPSLMLVTRQPDHGWALREVPISARDFRMPALSPDGRRIAYIRRADGPARFRAEDCVAILDLDTMGDRVAAEIGGPCWFPSWSPDGHSIAWLGHDSRHGVDEATDIGLWIAKGDGGAPREVSSGFGRSLEDVLLDDCTQAGGGPHPVYWDDDGHGIYVLATSAGSTDVWSFSVAEPRSQPVRVTEGKRRVFRFDRARGRLLLAVASPADPCQIELREDDHATTVFAPNGAWLSGRALATPERVVFVGSQGEEVEGWILSPPERPLAGAPAVLQINRGRFGWTFYLESQILAGAGFAVGFINPHGAYGYGEEFRATPHHDPATREVDDLLRAADVLVQRGVDGRRIGISGASYGGFLVNWLSSHTGERFAAAVSQASYCNRHNLWGTSSIGPTQWTSLGLPWARAEFLLSRSPISFVDQVRIPMLLIHGEHDTICPLEQAEQWYTALLVNGRKPECLIFRGEAHDLARNARPGTRTRRMTAIVDWFRRHLDG
jgi:dipeptidyl aminopeptidase/acylaminoacyl peptidase